MKNKTEVSYMSPCPSGDLIATDIMVLINHQWIMQGVIHCML